jgi:hypothetical protein
MVIPSLAPTHVALSIIAPNFDYSERNPPESFNTDMLSS